MHFLLINLTPEFTNTAKTTDSIQSQSSICALSAAVAAYKTDDYSVGEVKGEERHTMEGNKLFKICLSVSVLIPP